MLGCRTVWCCWWSPSAPGLPVPALPAVPFMVGGSPLVMVRGSGVAAWVWYSGLGSWPRGTPSCTSLLQKAAWRLAGVCLNRKMSDMGCWVVLGELFSLVVLSPVIWGLWERRSHYRGDAVFSAAQDSLPLLAGTSVHSHAHFHDTSSWTIPATSGLMQVPAGRDASSQEFGQLSLP